MEREMEKETPRPQSPLPSGIGADDLDQRLRSPELRGRRDFGNSVDYRVWPRNPRARSVPAWIRPRRQFTDADGDFFLPPDDPRVARHDFPPHGVRESRWESFSRRNAYPRPQGLQEQQVTPEWLNQNMGAYTEPWHRDGTDIEGTYKGKRPSFLVRCRKRLLMDPLVPLFLRAIVFAFSAAGIGIGGVIHHYRTTYDIRQGPSATMAIVVDAVALVYLVYVTYDEYTSRPLGLRSPRSKMRLIFLDVFFIIFDSVNLGLAFDALTDVQDSCRTVEINQLVSPANSKICEKQKALASVLIVALVAWVMVFATSVFRLVERVAPS